MDLRSRIELDAQALRNNFRVIRSHVPRQQILPMLKADAYGHDALWVARHLAPEAGCSGFGLATVEEGVRLRAGLGSAHSQIPLVIFSGTAHWSEEKGQLCERHQLIPVISSLEDWQHFFSEGWPQRLRYELKFNTGMNRLGIPWDCASEIVSQLKHKPELWQPRSVLSHLALSDRPQHEVSRMQLKRFVALRDQVARVFPHTLFHLGNTGAIWNAKAWKLDSLTQLVRPGIGLYGLLSDPRKQDHKLMPVMTFQAQVVHIFRPEQGSTLGYGGRYVVRKRGMHAAVLGAGYADGIHRGFWPGVAPSSRSAKPAQVFLRGKSAGFLGVVSMDVSVVECTPQTEVGDWVEVWGKKNNAWKLALAAGTIPYELFTHAGKRSERVYVE